MKLLNLQAFRIVFALLLQVMSLSAQELYTVNSVSFNMKDYDEFSPVYYKDGLVFCSNRTQNVFIARVDSLDRPLLELYFVKKKENQKWNSPSPIFKGLTIRKHEGPCAFSRDGRTMYLTQNEGNFNEIYITNFNGSTWDTPTPFQYDEANADVGHPCLSADGKRLFFVSNKRGGYGGFDIYVTTNVRNRWTQPKNLGPEVNSVADELYPFYHANGRLYFASNRANGFGELDIYYSKEKNGKWTKPVHLPAPINTRFNDFAFLSDSIDRHGFIASDRNNRTKLTDIYEFTMNFPVMNNCKEQEKNEYTYIIKEPSAINTDTTTFIYEWDFGDGKKLQGKSLEVEHTFPSTGDYLVQLNVIDTLTGSVFLNQTSYLFPVRNIEQPYISCADSVVMGEEVVFDANKTYLPDKLLISYYWDFDDETIAQNKEVKHKFKEAGTYRIMLSVTYTDSENTIPVTICRYKQITVSQAP